MIGYRMYRRKLFTWARPYVPGESLEGVSVSDEDEPREGGLIAISPENPDDRWYIAPEYARENLDLVHSRLELQEIR